jgi:hypothetical protein
MLNDYFLCVKTSKFGKIKCIKFLDFQSANEYFRERYIREHKNIEFSTILPVCKFNFFKETTIKYKLSKQILKIDYCE